MKGDSEGLLKLPTDKALLDDPKFRPYVELYAKVMWVSFSFILLLSNLSSFFFFLKFFFGRFIVRCHFNLGYPGVSCWQI